MTINDYAHALRRRWPIVAAVVGLGLVLLAVFGRGPGTAYRATQVLVFQESGNPAPDEYARDLRATAALAQTPGLAASVVGRLNATNSPADLARKITTRANVDDNTISIVTAPYASASKARALANAFAVELTNAIGDQQQSNSQQAAQASAAEQESTQNALRAVEAKLAAAAKGPPEQQDILRAQRDALTKHLQDTIVANLAVPPQQTLSSVGSAAVQKVDDNQLAPTSIPGWMLAAFLLGILGAAIALLVDRLDGRIRDRRGVERAFDLPVLAEVPSLPKDADDDGVVAATQPVSDAADAFRDLRTSLAHLGQPGRVAPGRANHLEMTAALVTSANRGEGKTTTAANLAAVVAETGKTVLLIDCDLRAPRAHEQLGVVAGEGLSDVLSGTATIDQVAVPTSVPGVRLVSAGRAVDNPSALFARQQDFLAPARMLADFVVLDGPPLAVHDAAELIWMVDAVVVSCRLGTTTVDDAARVNEHLAVLGAPPSGVVLTGSSDRGARFDDRRREAGGGDRADVRATPPPPMSPPSSGPGGTEPQPQSRPPFVPAAAPIMPPGPIPAPAPMPVPAGSPSPTRSSSLSISVPSPERGAVATAPAPPSHWGTRVQPGGAVDASAALGTVAPPAPPRPQSRPLSAPPAMPVPKPVAPPTRTTAPAPTPTVPPPTQAEQEAATADSETIRQQLALPARRIAGWAGTIALMVVMWVIIRTFLFQSFYIPSPSMAPALKPGDRVLVSKLSYRLHDVHRGDIVVFKRPPHVQAGPEVKDLVKRVIGLPGDTVEARNGQVLVNGKALKEPYVPKGATTTSVSPTHIPARHYWVMGDNRTVSEDSRYFGSINGDLIVGRVFFQVWPVGSAGLI